MSTRTPHKASKTIDYQPKLACFEPEPTEEPKSNDPVADCVLRCNLTLRQLRSGDQLAVDSELEKPLGICDHDRLTVWFLDGLNGVFVPADATLGCAPQMSALDILRRVAQRLRHLTHLDDYTARLCVVHGRLFSISIRHSEDAEYVLMLDKHAQTHHPGRVGSSNVFNVALRWNSDRYPDVLPRS